MVRVSKQNDTDIFWIYFKNKSSLGFFKNTNFKIRKKYIL